MATSGTEAIQRRSSGDEAARFIRQLIFDGELHPGTRVPQDDVARRLGISRIPVREALIALEREGWVTIEMHRGAFVSALDEQSVRDQYDLYGMTFAFAVERAIERSGDELAPTLQELAAEIAGSDTADGWRSALRFHEAVVRATGSPRIFVVLRAMPSMIPGNFFEVVPGAYEAEKRGFTAIARAVSRGDGPKAAEEYRRMMRRHGQRAVQVLESRGLFAPAAGGGPR